MIRKSIPSLVFLFFGVFLVIYSSYKLSDFQQFGAAFFPTITGVGIIIFSLLDLVFNLKERVKEIDFNEFKYAGLVVFIVITYIALSKHVGFILTGIMITAPMMMWFSRCSKLWSVVLSTCTVFFIYFLFSKVLLVPLPTLFN